MALVTINGVNYNQLMVPWPGHKFIWNLRGFSIGLLGNGAPSPFSQVPGISNFYVRVEAFGVVELTGLNALNLQSWLEGFLMADCPVDNGEIEVSNVNGTFSFVDIRPALIPHISYTGNAIPAAANTTLNGTGIIGGGGYFINGPTNPPPSNVANAVKTVNQLFGNMLTNVYIMGPSVCECGATKASGIAANSPGHSGWCPVAKKS